MAALLLMLALASAGCAPRATVAAPPALPATPATPIPLPSPSASPTPSPEYRIGAGDVLEVTVIGNDDLSRSATVQTTGTITMPLLGDVGVAGLTVEETAKKIADLYGKDFLVDSHVELKVKEYHSQFVTVLGEVTSPGRKPLRGHVRLIDVLVDAGGLTSRASGEISVMRAEGPFADGRLSLTLRLGGTLRPQDEIALQTILRAGDIISAAPKYHVTVEGEVAHPGRYVLETDLTVSGAVSAAGGLTRFGSNDVKVRRVDSETGLTTMIEVDLKSIRNGKQPDVPLLPNDVVSVPRRLF